MRRGTLLSLLRADHWSLAVTAGLLGAVLFVATSRGVIEHAPHYDELLHVLAAQGLLEVGEPVIAEGEYRRAELFTYMVASSLQWFGDDLVSARIPSLAAAALLVFVLATWLTLRAGLLPGAAAALFLCAFPAIIAIAVFARFYTLHALLITLVLIAAFEFSSPGRTRRVRVAWLVLAIVLIPLAGHLQETTFIAIGAGIAALLAVRALDHWQFAKARAIRHPVLIVGSCVLLAAIAVGLIYHLGFWDRLRSGPLWSADRAERAHYYLIRLRAELPWLWPLLPLAALVAVVNRSVRRLAVFAVVIVAFALIVHSLAAQKAMRYISYVVPWICVLWACALGAAISRVPDTADRTANRRNGAAAVVLLLVLGTGFVLSVEGTRMLNLLAGRLGAIDDLPYSEEPEWTPIVGTLAERVPVTNVLITSNSMKALYYFGRYDLELNATIVPETETGREFGRDSRTGGRAIGQAASVAQVMDAAGTKLVVLEEDKIGRASGVPAEAFAIIQSRCDELTLTAGSGVRSWWCDGTRSAP